MMCDADVVIMGAGPAGAVCATLLARAGVRVAVARGSGRNVRNIRNIRYSRPAEVFSPSTLRLLRHLDLPAPGAGHAARTCRGVLSVWGAPSRGVRATAFCNWERRKPEPRFPLSSPTGESSVHGM